jgi:hypothetical protein
VSISPILGAPGDVDSGFDQRLVHRHQRLAVAPDAALVANRAGESLAEDDADILGGVVIVDMQVALGVHGQVEQRMPGEGGEHVIQEADPRFKLDTTRPIQAEGQGDVGLGGRAGDLGGAHGRGIAQNGVTVLVRIDGGGSMRSRSAALDAMTSAT